MLKFSKTLYTLMAFLLLSIGISLQIKAGIGQSVFNAFCMCFSDLLDIKIGSIINFFNILFFIIYIFTKSSKINFNDFFQLLATIINGYLINIFTYNIFNHIIIQSYYLKVLIFLAGVFISSISLGFILSLEIIKFPLEALCINLSESFNSSLAKIRMKFDILFIILTLILTISLNHTLYIREGTIMSFFLLSRLLGYSYSFSKNIYKGDRNYV